ncbi:alpha/beta-hydrolase [Dendrothele bispora CBS 962.96]|uniref:Palmitoyl-protein thioesterase 1 n=1 Tax=Dendrothele bispora (strain CBS 962.96) TaxID=1314807 RepID=A0A4S8LB04_DENBC|nr:alpha/beta-hydrolase [Dendrothele bispora CBS 962.96]
MLRGSFLFLPVVASILSVYASYIPKQDLQSQIAPKPTKFVSNANSNPRPLVIWHGLGDSYNSPGILEFIGTIQERIPGIFVHSVYLDEEQDKDRQAGFYGNINDQIEIVAQQLAAIPELRVEGGFDAMGFSQGGQFLRAYVERYNSPPVHNLITFGSQHMGISDIPICRPYDLLCQLARRATKAGVYGNWAQENLIQAQYFRDPYNIDTYLAANHFLPDINNELPSSSSSSPQALSLGEKRNETYAENLTSLNALILIMFTQDKTVVPKESSWFGSEEIETETLGSSQTEFSNAVGGLGFQFDESDSMAQHPITSQQQSEFMMTREATVKGIIPMHSQPLYTEDWIGLRTLDERGVVFLELCEGEHMQLSACWEEVVDMWVGK